MFESVESETSYSNANDNEQQLYQGIPALVHHCNPPSPCCFFCGFQAYEVLGDPEKRRIYDAYGHDGDSAQHEAGGFYPQWVRERERGTDGR